MNNSIDYPKKIEAFRSHILPATSVLIVAHDYPDPDCIGSAYGITQLLSNWGIKTSVITFGGFVGRAENRAMIRYLNIDILPFPLLELKDFEKIILVDCFPGGGNVSLPADIPVHAVFDHHLDKPVANAPYFYDIRQDIGATSTLITKYLLESRCPISSKAATALFYGIKTDTREMGRDVSAEDQQCYKLLFDMMDFKVLSLIENPDRDIEFFRIVHSATESALCYGNVGFIHLKTVASPDLIAEMADFFHSLERLEWMICSGIFKKNIYFSIRSKNFSEAGLSAEKLARRLGGTGGGHGKIGAGRIPLKSKQVGDRLILEFIKIMKETFRIEDKGPETLLDV
jgi:nanoRNase/pAp phosphatase (c-di-AMP/oligoRNAs hydrolase)